jgi:threonine dehydrogenase-like Zn-dependent dehydrogenase
MTTATSRVRALRFIGGGGFEIQQIAKPSAPPGHSLVAPKFVGICATDLELLNGSHPYFGLGVARYPLQPGHEWSGVLLESTDRFEAGTRVAADPEVSCGRPNCPFCPAGRIPWCPDRQEIGCRGGLDGAAAEIVALPTRNLHAIPDSVDDRSAVLAEPAVTVLGGINRVGELSGRRALIIGAGTIGMIAAQTLPALGASVDVAVRSPHRAGALGDVGILHLEDPERDPLPTSYDVVFSAAGTAEAARLGIRALANGGQLVLLGVPASRVDDVDIASVLHKDATIHGVLNYSSAGPSQFDAALDLLATRRIDGSRIVDSVIPLSRARDAFDRAADRSRPRPKVLIEVAA